MSTPALPQGEEKVRAVRAMFDTIAPRYDLVNRVMTLGLDMGWRRRTVAALRLSPRSSVLDVATGTGDLCRELMAAGHRAIGLDMSRGMLAHARTTAPLIEGDALRMPLPAASVDGITSGFALRNFVDLRAAFAEMARVLRPGRRIALLDVAEPDSPLLHRGHSLWFNKVVPRIGALLSDGDAYRYLPRSTAYLPPPARLQDDLRTAGFIDVKRRLLSRGLCQLITGTRA